MIKNLGVTKLAEELRRLNGLKEEELYALKCERIHYILYNGSCEPEELHLPLGYYISRRFGRCRITNYANIVGGSDCFEVIIYCD